MTRIGGVMLVAALLVYGQSSSLLTGTAVDSNHVPLAGVKIHVLTAAGKEITTADTNSSGEYRFSLPTGRYGIHAEGEATQGPFAVEPGKTTTINLVLQQLQFSDEPQFTMAGVTDNTYRGGHGSDTVLRSAETLTKATASLGAPSAAEKSGHPLEAIKEFQRAAELNPSESNLFDWGAEFLVHRTPQPAAEVFLKGVQRYPQSARMLLGLATAQYAAGAYDQAAGTFFKAADLNPSDPNPYLFLTKVRARQITESTAYQERLERFAKLQPNSALANYAYAVSVWERRPAKARTLLEKAIAIDPLFGAAYLQLGIVSAGEQKYPEAIHEYRKAVEVEPGLEEAHYRLAEAYRLTGERVKAAQQLTLYNQLSKQSADKVEKERRAVQQFIIELRGQAQR